jgi:CDP-glycerol glycerophosphotransferase (TagB/SpsB family)
MPRFSIIVPVYQVQAYLHACLSSVLGQDFRDLELIAVDDASPDGCRDIIEEFAVADSRVSTVRLPRNGGAAAARNAGLDLATGEYLLFLDGDDILAPGALTAIDARLTEADRPQLLVCDHARILWHGERAPGCPPGLLGGRYSPAAAGPLADRPELLTLPAAVWDKVCRRDFLLATGLRFAPGCYAEVSWSYPALLTAQSLTVLDRVCVERRVHRLGAASCTPGHHHFDVFAQYEQLFALLDRRAARERPEDGWARWRAALYRGMTQRLSTVYRTPGLLPADCRAEFFRRASALCRRCGDGAPGTAAPMALREVREVREVREAAPALIRLLLRIGSHRAFRLLCAAGRAGRRLRSAGRALAGPAREGLGRLLYRLQRCRPLDPRLAVFTAQDGQDRTGAPAAIEAKARELLPGLRTAWVAGRGATPALPPGARLLRPGTPRYFTALARASWLVSDGDFPAGLAKRPGQRLLQTHRGTPLYPEGLDSRNRPGGAGPDLAGLLRHIDSWDYSLSGNRHTTLIRQRACPADYTTLEYGSPRTDLFHSATAADVRRIRTRLGVAEGTVAVLWAPSGRPAPPGARPPLDPARLARALGPGFVLLIRRARPDDGPPVTAPAVLEVSGAMCATELCLAADVLVTDGAPLLFDYAALDRPMVLHLPDWELHRAAHGCYLDLPAVAPGPVTRSVDELVAALTGTVWRDPVAAEARTAFRERFCPHDDGFASERVVRRVFLNEQRALPTVPFVSRRPIPGTVLGRAAAPGPRLAETGRSLCP